MNGVKVLILLVFLAGTFVGLLPFGLGMAIEKQLSGEHGILRNLPKNLTIADESFENGYQGSFYKGTIKHTQPQTLKDGRASKLVTSMGFKVFFNHSSLMSSLWNGLSRFEFSGLELLRYSFEFGPIKFLGSEDVRLDVAFSDFSIKGSGNLSTSGDVEFYFKTKPLRIDSDKYLVDFSSLEVTISGEIQNLSKVVNFDRKFEPQFVIKESKYEMRKASVMAEEKEIVSLSGLVFESLSEFDKFGIHSLRGVLSTGSLSVLDEFKGDQLLADWSLKNVFPVNVLSIEQEFKKIKQNFKKQEKKNKAAGLPTNLFEYLDKFLRKGFSTTPEVELAKFSVSLPEGNLRVKGKVNFPGVELRKFRIQEALENVAAEFKFSVDKYYILQAIAYRIKNSATQQIYERLGDFQFQRKGEFMAQTEVLKRKRAQAKEVNKLAKKIATEKQEFILKRLVQKNYFSLDQNVVSAKINYRSIGTRFNDILVNFDGVGELFEVPLSMINNYLVDTTLLPKRAPASIDLGIQEEEEELVEKPYTKEPNPLGPSAIIE